MARDSTELTSTGFALTRGFFFDGALFFANMFWVLWLPASLSEIPEATVGMLLAIGVATQLLGALLKRGPLVARLRAAGGRPRTGFMTTLLLFHLILFSVATLMSLMALGVYPRTASGQIADSPFWTGIALGVGALATTFVYRAATVPEGDRPIAHAGPAFEFAADLLLWVSVVVTTTFFWGLLYEDLDNVRGIGLGLRGTVLLIASSLLFVAFYLPQRYLFLVEDARSWRTWIQVWTAMLPLAFIVMFG